MKKFEQQLLRLKSALGLVSDQDVASLLGMSKAAFSDRKKRDSFPEDKLLALVAKRPDLVIDPQWVLHGKTAKDRYIEEHKQPPATYEVLARDTMRDLKVAEHDGDLMTLTPRERALIENYRGSSEQGKRAVESTASALSHGSDSNERKGGSK